MGTEEYAHALDSRTRSNTRLRRCRLRPFLVRGVYCVRVGRDASRPAGRERHVESTVGSHPMGPGTATPRVRRRARNCGATLFTLAACRSPRPRPSAGGDGCQQTPVIVGRLGAMPLAAAGLSRMLSAAAWSLQGVLPAWRRLSRVRSAARPARAGRGPVAVSLGVGFMAPAAAVLWTAPEASDAG